MAAVCVCVAIIGKDVSLGALNHRESNPHLLYYLQNAPQYIATSDLDQELDLQYKVHSVLDVVEEKCNAGNKPNAETNRDLYLGLLYSTEAHKM